MRAGKLDKTITIERFTETIDEYGVPRAAWAPVATVKAQIVQTSTEEFFRTSGEGAESLAVFRTRYIDGVTPTDRILYAAGKFDVKEVKEIGRRRGLEIRASGGGAES